MKTALFYSTKTGATETYAGLLAEQIGDCALINLAHDKANPQEFDRIILGGGVRMGTAYKPLRTFMKKNLNTLVNKQVWIFFCGIDDEGFSGAVKKNVPEELCQSAHATVLLKGIAPFNKSERESGVWIDRDALSGFVQEMES